MTRAPLSDQRQLIDLQRMDSQIARLVHERRNLPVLARIEATVEALRSNKRDAVVAAARLAEARREATRADDEVTQVVRRAAALRERLSSGIAGVRDLTAIQEEVLPHLINTVYILIQISSDTSSLFLLDNNLS